VVAPKVCFRAFKQVLHLQIPPLMTAAVRRGGGGGGGRGGGGGGGEVGQ